MNLKTAGCPRKPKVGASRRHEQHENVQKRYDADCHTKVESLMQLNTTICLLYFVLFVDKMVFPG